MRDMTILEAAEHLGVSKEAIHNRVRRGSLAVTLKEGVKYVSIDETQKPQTKAKTRRTSTAKVYTEKYYQFLEEQNASLQTKVDKLEGETRSLRDQKERMLIEEREKIEQIYKDKDEQLKSILHAISTQFMLQIPTDTQDASQEEALDVEVEMSQEQETPTRELISLKKYLKKQNLSQKKKEKIKSRFKKKAQKDERIIVLQGKYYIDSIKYDYKDLMK